MLLTWVLMKLWRERAGEVVGAVLAPVFKKISEVRRARTFHPDGLVFEAKVVPLSPAGKKLEGTAIVRCSGALFKRGPQLPDVLGVAIRFQDHPSVTTEAKAGDQDLLFATIVSPLTMPFSPLTTDVSDFSHNHFWAVSPFDVEASENERQRAKFRLTPLHRNAPLESTGTREERLREAVRAGVAGFTLELRKTWSLAWYPIATIQLEREVQLDQAALHFSAFNDGKGIVPRGFVQAIRLAVYPASQEGRPAHS